MAISNREKLALGQVLEKRVSLQDTKFKREKEIWGVWHDLHGPLADQNGHPRQHTQLCSRAPEMATSNREKLALGQVLEKRVSLQDTKFKRENEIGVCGTICMVRWRTKTGIPGSIPNCVAELRKWQFRIEKS